MRTLLVVDDQADIRLLYRAVFTRIGWSVMEAASGPDALAMLACGDSPDVVVLDVQMPDLDGWDTLASIRAHPLASDVPVILCTVKSRSDDARRAWQLGCDGYLTKPFSIAELTDEVTAVATRTSAERLAARAAKWAAASPCPHSPSVSQTR